MVNVDAIDLSMGYRLYRNLVAKKSKWIDAPGPNDNEPMHNVARLHKARNGLAHGTPEDLDKLWDEITLALRGLELQYRISLK